MTDQQDLITPSPELIEEWIELSRPSAVSYVDPNKLATLAARWGADQELKACCEHLKSSMSPRATINYLRAARRPRPTSLKKRALKAAEIELDPNGKNGSLIIRALKSLPEND